MSQRLPLYLLVAMANVRVLLVAGGLGGLCASTGREEPAPVFEMPKDLATPPLPVRQVAAQVARPIGTKTAPQRDG